MIANILLIVTFVAIGLLLYGRISGFRTQAADIVKQIHVVCIMGIVARLMARYVGDALVELLGYPYSNEWLSLVVYAVVAAALCFEVARLWALDYAVATAISDGFMSSSIRSALIIGVGMAECMVVEQLILDTEQMAVSHVITVVLYIWATLLISLVMGYFHDLARFVARKPYKTLALAVPMAIHAVVVVALYFVEKGLSIVDFSFAEWKIYAAFALFSVALLVLTAISARLLSRRANAALIKNVVDSNPIP